METKQKSRVLEILERLKSQEKPMGYKFKPTIEKPKERIEPVKTIQQHKVKEAMEAIERMEKKMKTNPTNYLNMYFDLVKLEKKFLKSVEEMEHSNVNPPELFAQEIEKKKLKILNKFGKASDLYKREEIQ